MTQALTRVFSRRRTRKEPEYLPPYFWHRASTWHAVTLTLYLAFIKLIEVTLGEPGIGAALVWSVVFNLALLPQWRRNRRRWAGRTLEELCPKLDAHFERPDVSQDEVWETLTRLAHFTGQMSVYTDLSPWFDSFSIRRTPWDGDEQRFTVYRRGHPKRVFTFYYS